MDPNENPAPEPGAVTFDDLFSVIGQYEVKTRMMAADLATLSKENEDLKAQLADKPKGK